MTAQKTPISPRPYKPPLRAAVEAWSAFDDSPYRLAFVGHIHRPMIYGMTSESPNEATRHRFIHNEPFALDCEDRHIIAVGAIGYSRDAFPNIRYAIYDEAKSTIEMRLIDGPVLNF